VAYVARVNDTRGGNPNRHDGMGRAWRSLNFIVGEHCNERGSANQYGSGGRLNPGFSNFESGQGVIIDGKAVAQGRRPSYRGGCGCGRVSSSRRGFGSCTPEKIFAISDGRR
jgi:hypothetical protein